METFRRKSGNYKRFANHPLGVITELRDLLFAQTEVKLRNQLCFVRNNFPKYKPTHTSIVVSDSNAMVLTKKLDTTTVGNDVIWNKTNNVKIRLPYSKRKFCTFIRFVESYVNDYATCWLKKKKNTKKNRWLYKFFSRIDFCYTTNRCRPVLKTGFKIDFEHRLKPQFQLKTKSKIIIIIKKSNTHLLSWKYSTFPVLLNRNWKKFKTD